MKPPLGDASEPDEDGADARVIQRAIGNLRDRVRVQDDEIDTLRAMIRVLQKHGTSDQLAQLQSRMDALADVQQSLLESQGEQGAGAERLRKELLPRVQSLEAGAMDQARAMQEMREVVIRTDTNLQRLLTEVDRLVTEVARRPEPAPAADAANPAAAQTVPEAAPTPLFDAEVEEMRFRWRVPAILLVAVVCLFLAVWGISALVRGTSGRTGGTADATGSLSPIEQGRVYESQKNYAKAEAIYKDLLKKDPNNNEVIRHLAGVLFREDKWEESAAELKKLNGPAQDSTSQ
jgi:tetratricopeptide (TPR) repeat protein